MTTLKKIFSKKREVLRPTALYLDYSVIPLYNWERIIEDGDIRYLIIKDGQRNQHVNPSRFVTAYDTISDQYFADLGIDLMNDELYALMQHKAEAIERYVNGDRSALNNVRMYNAQIKDLKSDDIKADLVKQRMSVSKWFRQPIDPRKTTLKEFCKIIKLMREETEQMIKKPTQNGDSQED